MTIDWLSGAYYLLGVVAGVCCRDSILWGLHEAWSRCVAAVRALGGR